MHFWTQKNRGVESACSRTCSWLFEWHEQCSSLFCHHLNVHSNKHVREQCSGKAGTDHPNAALGTEAGLLYTCTCISISTEIMSSRHLWTYLTYHLTCSFFDHLLKPHYKANLQVRAFTACFQITSKYRIFWLTTLNALYSNIWARIHQES